MTTLLSSLAFGAGLAVLCWVGADYWPTQPLALAVTLLIAAFYVLGAVESWRFERATRALDRALRGLAEAPASLSDWLAAVPDTLRGPVRQRIEGARQGLPGPTIAAYLTGLLILLGMLGTFLGMVVTLAGTAAALSGADGLSAIRNALTAPVRGLGLAFGTSVAGVATSAMLGLMLALARWRRIGVARRLDLAVATTLKPFSQQHQREVSLKLLEQQAAALPTLVDRIDRCMNAIEHRQQALVDQLGTTQGRQLEHTDARFVQLAATVERVLTSSAADSARHAQAVIAPALQQALAGLAEQATTLQEGLAAQVGAHLAGIGERFDATSTRIAAQWDETVAVQRRANEAGAQSLDASLQRFTQSFETQVEGLAQALAERVDGRSKTLAQQLSSQTEALAGALQRQTEGLATTLLARTDSATTALEARTQALADRVARQTEGLAEQFATQAQAMTQQVAALTEALSEHVAARTEALSEHVTARTEALSEQVAARTEALSQHVVAQSAAMSERLVADDQSRLAQWTQTLQQLGDELSDQWRQSGANAVQHWQQVSEAMQRSHESIGQRVETQADRWAQRIASRAQADDARITMATDALSALSDALHAQWRETGAQATSHWQQADQALRQTASEITAGLQRQADATLAQIGQLVEAASEAPRVAADVIGELRQKLSDSLVHDNAVLAERNRLLETLGNLVDTVNHAAGEQRAAIDALVGNSSELLSRTHAQFADALAQPQQRLETAATQIASGAIDVASLGEAFGGAAASFSQSNEQMIAHLQRIEAALGQSLARSDEQLDYYVAQAREVIELSIGAQKQIIDELRQVASTRADADRAVDVN